MIKKIGIENFKAFSDYTEINFSDLTIFSGLNSSGKSSIYQAILLLAQSHEKFFTDEVNRIPHLVLNGNYIRLGKTNEILNDRQRKQIKLFLEWDDFSKITLIYSLEKNNNNEELFYLTETSFDSEKKSYKVVKTEKGWAVNANNIFDFSSQTVKRLIFNCISESYPDLKNEDDIYNHNVFFSNVIGVDLLNNTLGGLILPLEEIKECLSDSFKELIDISKLRELLKENHLLVKDSIILLNSDSYEIRNKFFDDEDIIYSPPFRGYPERIYIDGINPNPLDLFLKKNKLVVPYKYNFEKETIEFEQLDKAFKYWVVDFFNLADNISIAEAIEGLAVEINFFLKERVIPINNVGFGISQLLPIIIKMLANEKEEQLFIVDEPEIHLHPSAQSKLADFFLHMAMIKKRIIIETHSEYFLEKMIYLSIKNNISKESMNLYWIKKDFDNTHIEKIEYDDLGYIINTPDFFITERKKLTKELTELRLKKIEE